MGHCCILFYEYIVNYLHQRLSTMYNSDIWKTCSIIIGIWRGGHMLPPPLSSAPDSKENTFRLVMSCQNTVKKHLLIPIILYTVKKECFESTLICYKKPWQKQDLYLNLQFLRQLHYTNFSNTFKTFCSEIAVKSFTVFKI